MKTEETPNKAGESAEAKSKEAPAATNTGAPEKTDVNAKNAETESKGKPEEAGAAKTEATTATAEKNDEVNIDELLEAGAQDAAETKTEKPAEGTKEASSVEADTTGESVQAKSEEEPVNAKEAAAPETTAPAEAADKTTEVNIDELLEAGTQDTAGENAEETLDLIEEVEEVSGTTDENAEAKAEGTAQPAADSTETKGSEEAAKTTATEAVEDVASTTDESSETEIESPSSDAVVQSIDIKDFKSLLAEREAERQSLKNKVKELEEALTTKTQELNQKIEEYKAFHESEKELLTIYKELKESSIAQ